MRLTVCGPQSAAHSPPHTVSGRRQSLAANAHSESAAKENSDAHKQATSLRQTHAQLLPAGRQLRHQSRPVWRRHLQLPARRPSLRLSVNWASVPGGKRAANWQKAHSSCCKSERPPLLVLEGAQLAPRRTGARLLTARRKRQLQIAAPEGRSICFPPPKGTKSGQGRPEVGHKLGRSWAEVVGRGKRAALNLHPQLSVHFSFYFHFHFHFYFHTQLAAH